MKYCVSLLVPLLLLGAATASADTVRVTADSALVWTRPVGVSVVVTQLPKDAVVEVLRRFDDWYEIVLPPGSGGNRTGFIRVAQVAIESIGPPSAQAARLMTARAPRSQPSRSSVVNIDAVRRVTAGDLTRSSPAFADVYAEAGGITADYGRGTGWGLDVLIGQTVWGPIGVGVGAGYYVRKRPASVDAQVPHPFFFNAPRSATFETERLTGSETAVHVPVLWMPRPRGGIQMIAFGGLSIFRVSQNVVTNLGLNDPYPHDAVIVERAITEERKGTVVGFHAGADVSYFFTPTIGVGVGARYSRADLELQKDAGATTTGLAGAAQAAAGLRFRF